MRTTQTVHLYVTDTMADWEAGHSIAHLRKRDWQREPGRYAVRTVAAAAGTVTTMGGVTIEPDHTLDRLAPEDSAMLILTGADTWKQGSAHDGVLRAARTFLDAGTPVAAICGATFGMAAAGLLDGRDHTSNAAEYLLMSGYGGGERYRDEPAVADRGLITAGGTHPVDFAAAIFAELDLYEPAVLEAWHGLYTTGDPAHFAVLAAA